MKAKHFALLLTVALLLGAVTAAAAAENMVLPAAIVPNSPEIEPNDDFASATWIDWGTFYWNASLTARMAGKLEPATDTDTYGFQPDYLDTLTVEWRQWRATPASTLSLYDQYGGLLAEATCPTEGVCLQYVMTEAGSNHPSYYLKVANADPGSSVVTHYEMTLNYAGTTDPYEPNNSPAEATPIAYEAHRLGMVQPCTDLDYYRFDGRAGDQFTIETHEYDYYVNVRVQDAEQHEVATDFGTYTLPADGIYYLVAGVDDDTGDCDRVYRFHFNYLDQPLYLSFDKNGQVQGIPFTSGDVLRYWTRSERWEMHVDMSDLGLVGNLTVLGQASAYEPSFFLGFASNYALESVGTVTPQDLVEFEPISVGEDTSGSLVFRFDGSDVGLTSSSERIDALGGDCINCWYSSQPKWISIAGRGRVPYDMGELTLQDEDLAGFYLASYWGTNISGTWTPRFDGSQYGLGAADLIGTDAAYYYNAETGDEGEILWLSFDRQVRFGGIVLAPGDIAACRDSRYDGDDLCDSVSKFFDASDAGLSGVKIDALEVGRVD